MEKVYIFFLPETLSLSLVSGVRIFEDVADSKVFIIMSRSLCLHRLHVCTIFATNLISNSFGYMIIIQKK